MTVFACNVPQTPDAPAVVTKAMFNTSGNEKYKYTIEQGNSTFIYYSSDKFSVGDSLRFYRVSYDSISPRLNSIQNNQYP